MVVWPGLTLPTGRAGCGAPWAVQVKGHPAGEAEVCRWLVLIAGLGGAQEGRSERRFLPLVPGLGLLSKRFGDGLQSGGSCVGFVGFRF